MVLKRILVTALGALGLGALAAGTALGQAPPPAGEGNIPAPDIFDDQITCNMVVPTETQVGPVPASVVLDTLIAMGTIDTDATGPGTYEDLGYVIPPAGSNCGQGANAAAFTFEQQGDIATDVAHGYTELLDKYVAVYGNPGGTTGGTARALATAQNALSDGLRDGAAGTVLAALQEDATAAQEAHNKAMAEFREASQGPIYQAGVAEWMAKAAVTKSVMEYNPQVVATNMALTALNDMDYASYVSLANDELITTVVTFDAQGMGTIQANQLAQYANADAARVTDNSGTIDGMGVTDSTGGNFTTTGQLIIPMSLQDHDNDAATDLVLRPVLDTTDNGVDDIRTRVERVNAAAELLKEQRDDNTNPLLQPLYDEAYRRAQAEADYYNTEWAEVLADTTDIRTAQQKLEYLDTNGNGINEAGERTDGNRNTSNYIPNPISIASRNAAHIAESNKLVAAVADLRSKVSARVMATVEVQEQFADAQAFYEQLVARRQALKVAADRDVASAETPTMAMRDAAERAGAALAAARDAKEELDMLFDDENDPTVELIDTLLRTGGDDGKALVDAISSNYGTAREAKMKADEVAESVMGLTGDEGQVSANTDRIMQNEEDIDMLDGRVTKNEADIETNKTMIATNAGNIATNAENIMTNTTMIKTNTGDIMTNAGNIAMNSENIMDNSGRITANEGKIMTNMSDIAANKTAIGANRTNIMQNADMIGGLQDQMEVVRAGVAASMALAGMPAINGRGISIGVGSFDGESAFAVGFQIQSEMASFKVGVTSAGGETGASAGVGFQF